MKKFLSILLALVILGELSTIGFILYKKFLPQIVSPQIEGTEPTLSTQSKFQSITPTNTPTEKTWDDCKVLPTEMDYLPKKIASFEASNRQNATLHTFIGSYKNTLGTSISIIISKNVPGSPDEDINSVWQKTIDNWSPNNLNKDVFGSTLLSTSKENYYGSEAIIAVTKHQSNGKEEIITELDTLISKHNILATVSVIGQDNKTEVINDYQRWFETVCQLK